MCPIYLGGMLIDLANHEVREGFGIGVVFPIGIVFDGRQELLAAGASMFNVTGRMLQVNVAAHIHGESIKGNGDASGQEAEGEQTQDRAKVEMMVEPGVEDDE